MIHPKTNTDNGHAGHRQDEILIVDDSVDNLQLLEKILLDAGYRVRLATNGALALRSLAARASDLVLLDVKMPKEDGYAVCRRLKDHVHTADIPVIFISALDETPDKVKGFEAGGVDYITKPFQPREVLARVKIHLSLRRMQIDLEHAKEKVEEQVRHRTLELEQANIALKNRELLLNEMGKLARIGGWEHDLTTGKTVLTNEIYSILEIAPDAVFGHAEHLACYPAEERIVFEKAYNRSIATGEKFDLKLQAATVKGRMRWLHVVGRPECHDGACIKMKGTSQDITEQKQIEEQLHQAQKMESIGRLAGGVAHDFNNMLSVIIGYGDQLLHETPKTDPRWEFMNQIVIAGQRSAALTRQLLAFSRRQVLQPEVISLNRIIHDLEKMLHRVIGEDIRLMTRFDDGLHLVKVDPGQIEQVIMNLAVNARDAMPQGGNLTIETANVEIDTHYADSHVGAVPGHYVMLSITDTGCGMNDETRERIFEPFFTTKERGTGLGLSTVYGIIKQSGGNIWVYSEPGQGTIFKIYLPQTSDDISVKKQMPANGEIGGQGELILLVEDDPSLRDLCERILNILNYQVAAAENGRQALYLVENQHLRPDLVITDVVMPEMSGKVLADCLKEKMPHIKILFMSGYTDNAIVHHGVLDSGIPFIQKPFTKNDIGKAVKALLIS